MTRGSEPGMYVVPLPANESECGFDVARGGWVGATCRERAHEGHERGFALMGERLEAEVALRVEVLRGREEDAALEVHRPAAEQVEPES